VLPIRQDKSTDSEPTAEIARVRAYENSSQEQRGLAVSPEPYLHKLLVPPDEAAVILSLGRTKVFELMATGHLPSVRIGSSRRIPVSALERFVEQLLEDGDGG
jgi:excisionase family DNA binding protein